MATSPRSTFTALPRRGEQSCRQEENLRMGAPLKVVFDAVTDDVTPPKFALV
jgi:hypothetical protein